MTPQSIVVWFANAYRVIGLDGCSSHSGRRTFLTQSGLPVGFELDGPVGSDPRLLAIAIGLERIFGTLPAPNI